MCHEYGTRWWKSESTARKRTEDAKPEVMATFTVRQNEKAKAVPTNNVDEKELVPAE